MMKILLLALALGVSSAHAVSFPPEFKWCVATAAHQIEGYNTNSDWWDWEQQPGHIKNGEKSGAACDHWNRLETDTQLMKDLHVQQYRFSVEWAKIEPKPGQWDWEAVKHYRRELELLRAAGIEPLVTLQHFTLPRWVREQGGWEWDEAPARFANYARFVLQAVGPGVRDWITINEPMVHLTLGYAGGFQPPGKKGDLNAIVAPLEGLLRAHAAAYHALHAEHGRLVLLDHRNRYGRRYRVHPSADLRVGLAHHLRVFDPASDWNPADAFVASKLDDAFNWAFPDAVETGRLRVNIPLNIDLDTQIDGLAQTEDFIGVNYYTRDMVTFLTEAPGFSLGVPKDAELTDVGWEIYPEGFYRVLKSVASRYPDKPILITENGLADHDDSKRERFIRSHLEALARAMGEGVKVENYCYWSLMDNFEWSEGFAPRFGLYEVDYSTFKRTPRPSARFFSELARTGQLGDTP